MVWFMVLNATFNTIIVISWRSVLLEKTGVPRENPDLLQVTDKLIMLYQIHLAMKGFEHTILVVIDTDFIGSCKSNYHTTTTAPLCKDVTEKSKY